MKSNASLGSTVEPGRVIESLRLRKKKTKQNLLNIFKKDDGSGSGHDGGGDGQSGAA